MEIQLGRNLRIPKDIQGAWDGARQIMNNATTDITSEGKSKIEGPLYL